MSPDMPQTRFDPSNPTDIAVRFTQIENLIARGQENTRALVENVQRGVDGISTNMRDLSKKLDDQPDAADMDRAVRTIELLARTTDNRFESAEKEFEAWRTTHEAENKQTRDRMILWNGIAMGFSVLASVLLGSILYIYQGDKAERDAADRRLETDLKALQVRLDTRIETTDRTSRAAVGEIERYLIQESTISGRPYVPAHR